MCRLEPVLDKVLSDGKQTICVTDLHLHVEKDIWNRATDPPRLGQAGWELFEPAEFFHFRTWWHEKTVSRADLRDTSLEMLAFDNASRECHGCTLNSNSKGVQRSTEQPAVTFALQACFLWDGLVSLCLGFHAYACSLPYQAWILLLLFLIFSCKDTS